MKLQHRLTDTINCSKSAQGAALGGVNDIVLGVYIMCKTNAMWTSTSPCSCP